MDYGFSHSPFLFIFTYMKYLLFILFFLQIAFSFGQNQIFESVDMPALYSACPNALSIEEKVACSQRELVSVITRNIKYSSSTIESGFQGIVYISFVINTDGTISHIKKESDIGYGLEDAVIDVLNSMNQAWIPATHMGQLVRMKYTLPVNFKF